NMSFCPINSRSGVIMSCLTASGYGSCTNQNMSFCPINSRSAVIMSCLTASGYGSCTNQVTLSDLTSRKLHPSDSTMSKPYVTHLLKRLVTSAIGPTAESTKVASKGAEVHQRSTEWFELRRDRLTSSSFSTALGFWKGRRAELWVEKVFLSDPNHLNSAVAAMSWGVVNEASAIERYTSITGREVTQLGFKTHPNEPQLGWLGASPDGLISGPGDELVCGPSEGILEVKCPFNKGRPELGLPWPSVPYYYMPQLQGLMEILERDWVDLYCWTPNGSTLFRVVRDREYWDLIYGILKEFWLEHVVPAREALLACEDEAAVCRYMPLAKHAHTNNVIAQSRVLAADARLLCKDIGGQVEFFR
ncbi:hypothetical protein AMTR_s00104p00078060, partial [Amborella trichopoda]